MTRWDEDEVFSRFVEERRELGFRGDRPPQRRLSINWQFLAVVAVVLGAGLITVTSTRIDTEVTVVLPQ